MHKSHSSHLPLKGGSMLRRLLLKSRLSIVAPIALIAMTGTMLLLLLCSMDNPVTPPEPTWSFTLDVLNGYSGAKIPGASVQYMKDLSDTVVTTNTAGRVKIEKLPAGTQSFTISYNDTVTKYTSVVVQAASLYSADSNKLNKLTDQAKAIKLFPLSASISGTVVSKINGMATKLPVKGALVSVTYDNADLADNSNVSAEVKTDSLGAFIITGLPLATGCKVTIATTKIGSIYFKAETFTPTLVKGIVSLPEVLMSPVNAAGFALKSTLPNFISPNDSIVLTYSDPVDSTSYVRLEGVSGPIQVTTKAIGSNLIITPAISLVDSSTYSLTVYAFGKAGGSVVPTTETFQVRGGGIIDVLTSNVLDANHAAKDGLGLTDSMKFTFRSPITTASATVKQGDKVILVDIYALGTDLVIKPKGTWEAGTYTVKVSANLAYGKTASFSFDIATVGALDFVSSNVYNPQLQNGINGLGFKDTIVVTANKPLASVKAILTQAGVSVPISSTISGSVVKIKSADDLRPATSYELNITVSTLEGESKSFSAGFKTASSDFYPVSDNIRFDNDPNKPVLNFQPNGAIIIKMSAAIHSATAQITGNFPINVTWSTDTIRITPVGNFTEGTLYTLKVSAESNTGTVYNDTYVSGFIAQANKVFVIASNVMNTNGLGLTNIPITIAPYFVLSATPVEATLAVQVKTGGTAINATITVSGDTVKVQPVKNLTTAADYEVFIKGKTTQNISIDLSMTIVNKAAFTTRQSVFVVATNMQDLQQNPVNNLLPSTELWVKFSRMLSTDLTKQKLAGGVGTTAKYTNGATDNNVAIRVSGDTLFAKFLPNLLPTDGDTVSLGLSSIVFDDATMLIPLTLKAKVVEKQKPYVIATNGMKDNIAIDTFNVLDEVWIVSSLPFSSVDSVKDISVPANPILVAQNFVMSNVRTHGDTIFFKPSYPLLSDKKYTMSFYVSLPNGQKGTSYELRAIWATGLGIKLASTNDMNTSKTLYREFKCIGDSLVALFSQAVDTSKPFSITNFGSASKLTYHWSSDLKTVTIKDTSKLTPKDYAFTPDYSPTGTAQYGQLSDISFTLTSVYGEPRAFTANSDYAGKRPNLKIHTEVELVVVDANVLKTHNNDAVLATDQVIDTLSPTANITITFNRAIDTAAIKAAHRDAHFMLVNSASPTVPFEYAISFSNSARTVTLDPVDSLTRTADYNVKIIGVIDNQSHDTYSGVGAGNYLTSNAFGIKNAAAVQSIAALACSLYVDANAVTGVAGNRIGASPTVSGSAYGLANLQSESGIILKLKEAAWNVNHTDSVDGYQWRIRKVLRNGQAFDWFETRVVGDLVVTPARATGFGSDDVNAAQLYKRITVNPLNASTMVGSGSIISAIRTNELRAGYNNPDHIFNDSSKIQIQVRPYKDLDGNSGTPTAGEFGVWSNIITLADNLAPCDSDFVDSTNFDNQSAGGVGVVPTNIGGTGIDRSGVGTSAGTFVVTLNFPEDMDTSIAPQLTIFYGAALAAGVTPVTKTGRYSNATTYVFTCTLAAGTDYTPYAPYYTVNVAGMKDVSGVTIAQTGSTGTAAIGTLLTAVTGQIRGSVNIHSARLIQ